MISPPEVETTTEITTAVILLVIPREEMAKYMDPAIKEILATVVGQGIALTGPCVAFHHRRPTDTFDFELGFPVARPIEPTGRVVNSVLPAVKVVRTLYRGSYDGLPQAWQALHVWVGENGLASDGRFWESYLNNPAQVADPNDYETELVWVVG